MRKRTALLISIVLLILTGCGVERNVPADDVREEAVVYSSNISVKDCWLCGDRTDTHLSSYWGQNNIGIISLNSFEVIAASINRYNADGTLLEEQTGVLTSRFYGNQDGGFICGLWEDVDRGYASGSITFKKDRVLDTEKAASFLCQKCLDSVLSEIYQEGYGVGVINFETRELRAFEKNFVGFGLGDFYISCDFTDTEKWDSAPDINFLIFYAPIRYAS